MRWKWHLCRFFVEAVTEAGPHRAERPGVLFADGVIFGDDEAEGLGDFLGHALVRAGRVLVLAWIFERLEAMGLVPFSSAPRSR
jgi:hypothetical protein